MIELQFKFEVISISDGGFRTGNVSLDEIRLNRRPERAKRFNSEIFRDTADREVSAKPIDQLTRNFQENIELPSKAKM